MPAIIFDCGIEWELYVDCEQLLIIKHVIEKYYFNLLKLQKLVKNM